MTTLPNFRIKTLEEARAELAKFGITSKVSTLGQARKLLLAKRAELAQAKFADKAKLAADVATSTIATIIKPTIAPLATSKAAPVTKPVVFDVTNYLALRMKQLSGVYLTKAESASLAFADDCTAVIESAIETLSKTTAYHEGVLLSNAYRTLQGSELTKHIDPRDILADIKASKAIKAKSDREAKAFPSWRSSSN
jgi:hypothetical protein